MTHDYLVSEAPHHRVTQLQSETIFITTIDTYIASWVAAVTSTGRPNS